LPRKASAEYIEELEIVGETMLLRHRSSNPVRTSRVLALAGALISCSLLVGSPATAKGKAPAKEKASAKLVPVDDAPSPETEALRKKLAGSEDDVLDALKSIGDSGNAEAAPLLIELLARGGSQKVLEEALKTAAKLKAPSLSVAVAPYVQHRVPDIRHAAVRALLKTKGPAALVALKKGLRSSDALIRGTSATGLGALGAHEAIDDLFRAFDHGVAEAGAGIGQLCTPEECEKFAGFDQILFRADVPDDAKIKLVGRMRELGTPEVGKYLGDVNERWPKDWSKKVKQSIESAARAVAGGTKK
jgi:hypothetical protein